MRCNNQKSRDPPKKLRFVDEIDEQTERYGEMEYRSVRLLQRRHGTCGNVRLPHLLMSLSFQVVLVVLYVLGFAAPSISNVQAAIEHIYPLVLEFKMDKPEPRSSDKFCGGSAPTYAQSWRRVHASANWYDDKFN